MTKRAKDDADLKALTGACLALERSTSTRMLRATLDFIWDRYLMHPPPDAWWRYEVTRKRAKGGAA